MNLTVQQEKAAVRVLRQLVKKSGKMLPNASFTLWGGPPNQTSGWGGTWSALTVSRHGLRVESGRTHVCTISCECNIWGREKDRLNKPRVLQPTEDVVRDYELTALALRKYLAKLR